MTEPSPVCEARSGVGVGVGLGVNVGVGMGVGSGGMMGVKLAEIMGDGVTAGTGVEVGLGLTAIILICVSVRVATRGIGEPVAITVGGAFVSAGTSWQLASRLANKRMRRE